MRYNTIYYITNRVCARLRALVKERIQAYAHLCAVYKIEQLHILECASALCWKLHELEGASALCRE
jgi:hypothetical protein